MKINLTDFHSQLCSFVIPVTGTTTVDLALTGNYQSTGWTHLRQDVHRLMFMEVNFECITLLCEMFLKKQNTTGSQFLTSENCLETMKKDLLPEDGWEEHGYSVKLSRDCKLTVLNRQECMETIHYPSFATDPSMLSCINIGLFKSVSYRFQLH